MSFCIALAVREMGMTIEEAVVAATLGGAGALRRHDLGFLGPGARADAIMLDATSYIDLVYRPGVPLVDAVILAGELRDVGRVWPAAQAPRGDEESS